jgi:hypothetical protein
MAEFCTATRISPSEYRKLTLREIDAFIDVLNKRNGPDLEDMI